MCVYFSVFCDLGGIFSILLYFQYFAILSILSIFSVFCDIVDISSILITLSISSVARAFGIRIIAYLRILQFRFGSIGPGILPIKVHK